MAKGDVWISEFFSDSRYVRGDHVDWTAPGWRDIAKKRLPPPETLPLPVYAEYKGTEFPKLLPIACGGGGVYVNRALANVFQRFDLANDPEEGGVVPIQFFLYDRTTVVEADYFTVVYGGQRRDEVVPDESKGLRVPKDASPPPSRYLLSTIKDGDIAVRPTARSGPDIWFDTKLHSAFFLSDRLVQALEDVGAARHFNPTRCRVVEFH